MSLRLKLDVNLTMLKGYSITKTVGLYYKSITNGCFNPSFNISEVGLYNVVNIEVKLLKYTISSTEQQNRGAMFSTATIRDAEGMMRGEGRSRDNQSGGKGEG